MDMGGIFQLISVAGFALAAVGIALIVSAATRERPIRGGLLLTILGVVFGILFMVISWGVLVVGPTQVAVVFNSLTGRLEDPRRSGISIVIPGVQVVTMYPISQQEYTMSGIGMEGAREGNDAVEARSVDGQEVTMDVTILFRIKPEPENVNQIHLDWSDIPGSYREALVRPVTRSVIRDVVSTFQAEEIYGEGRTAMQEQIETQLRGELEGRGFQLDNVLIRNVTFSPQFTDAIERKQIEEQELQRSRTEAERVRTEAGGRADAAIEAARGEAEAILVRAQAEAEALRLVSQQIAANPNLLQYIYISTLADNISLALIPSNTPFLFDSSTFTQLAPDFVPPALPETETAPEPEATPAGN